MLLDGYTVVKWNGANRKHYESLGYIYTKKGNEFEVKISHLIPTSLFEANICCDNCEELFKLTFRSYKNNDKDYCRKCIEKNKKTRVRVGQSLADKYPYLIKEWSSKNNLSPYDYSYSSNKDVIWSCERGHEWIASPNRRTNMGTNCPHCKESLGEKAVRVFLENNNIAFMQQYSFKDLLSENNYPLKFDFAIFIKDKLYCLIEYDGEQHYKPKFGDDEFEITQYRDNLKNIYCKENNIALLRIHYLEFENIEKILKEYLNV